jgi:hypothetical protein
MWFPPWSMVVWWCFAGDMVWFRIQGTLNQHGYHSIMQQYTIPSGLCLVGLSFVFQQDNDPTHLQAGYGLFYQGEWYIRWHSLHSHPTSPQLRWFGMSWTAVKEKKQTSAPHMWELLQDCWKSIPGEAGWENAKCAKLSKANSGYFEESKIYLDLFNIFWVTTRVHCFPQHRK